MSETTSPAPDGGSGRSWKKMLIQAVIVQVVMRFLSSRMSQRPAENSLGGQVIPPLQNAYGSNTTFDVFVYVTTNRSAEFRDLFSTVNPVWFVSSERYIYNRKAPPRQPENPIQYVMSSSLFNTLVEQRHQFNAAKTTATSPADTTRPSSSFSENTEQLLDRLSGLSQLRRINQIKQKLVSVYLLAFAVPHDVYKKLPGCALMPSTLGEALQCLASYEGMGSDSSEHILRGEINLIEYDKPFHEDDTLQNLWNTQQDNVSENPSFPEAQKPQVGGEIQPHWKNHIDIRFVVDEAPVVPQTLANPHLRRSIVTLPEEGLYLPVLQASDIWLQERHYIPLNETLGENPSLNLTLSLSSLNMFWWSVQSQFSEIWNPSADSLPNPWIALQRQSKSETFMLKRVMLDTNPYILVFSGLFMLLHSVFSFLAVKNDIQFWYRNESMEGLSMLTILFNFVCDIIVGLYLYDSKETSLLILFEIGLGIVLSAWKVTKAIHVTITWSPGRWFPQLQCNGRQTSLETETQKYDRIAIRFMSMLLFPCMLAYAVYALRYKKFKSWYSYCISTLAGTVYTFGFITMTPQLYINYKLKSVDHLPWRAFTYKALNTFVDDVAAFIIDMPWMHRLACFRDDIIFFCYLYQRWIYSVDKKRDGMGSIRATCVKEEESLLLNHEEEHVDDAKENSEQQMEPLENVSRETLRQRKVVEQ